MNCCTTSTTTSTTTTTASMSCLACWPQNPPQNAYVTLSGFLNGFSSLNQTFTLPLNVSQDVSTNCVYEIQISPISCSGLEETWLWVDIDPGASPPKIIVSTDGPCVDFRLEFTPPLDCSITDLQIPIFAPCNFPTCFNNPTCTLSLS